MMRTRDKGYPVGRGALLIINQGTFTSPDLKCREPGTSKDRDSLELVFRSLGYGVHIANDCNKDAFEGHLENAVDLIGDGVGPFVLAFLSHGDSGDLLYFADGTHMSRFEIRRTLQRHRTLHGRPKIIIVQACRGPEHLVVLKDGSTEIRIEGEDFSPDSVIADPMADTIIMWSCMEERVAYRHPDIGSMFITLTCDEILKNMSLAKRTPPSGEKHIPDLSMSVHKNMERYGTKCHGFRMLTSPENISSLKKPLFLGPPVDEDKFRRAVGRINQLRLKLSRATGQVVSNLQADDAQKGKCREQS
ncbi:caspase-14-like isoform X3 [Frankliniella occidentalis]|uniref:Caspase-14-like isoform X3 n=1 Tax=Frankliniella occidentalis TaxID=133901 RepID=A0A9C6X295_FRAOC|nr:caspase-14-like isoform X3 [Frankliniella occidentalis]